jgi:hypothetical protein
MDAVEQMQEDGCSRWAIHSYWSLTSRPWPFALFSNLESSSCRCLAKFWGGWRGLAVT